MTVTINTPQQLNTQTLIATQTPQPMPAPPTIQLPKTLSYQFQVVEYVDSGNNVIKVELQVQQTEHDNYGYPIGGSGFIPVPRIRLPLV